MKLITICLLVFSFAMPSFASPVTNAQPMEVGLTLHDSLMVAAGGQVTAAHTVTVNAVYPFNLVSGCNAGQTTGCVKQLNVYTTIGGTKTLLFSIPVPAGANTSQALTATSPSFTAAPGNITVSTTAITPDGVESAPLAATLAVPLPPLTSCTDTLN